MGAVAQKHGEAANDSVAAAKFKADLAMHRLNRTIRHTFVSLNHKKICLKPSLRPAVFQDPATLLN